MVLCRSFTAASYLAPNSLWLYQAIAAYWQRVLAIPVTLSQSWLDPLSDPDMINDRIDIAWMCGLPFARYARSTAHLQVLAAPVMQADRYHNHPSYFSDVIVRADSHVTSFAQLCHTTFCYNDPGSNSGYYLVGHRLMQAGYSIRFFSQMLQSGSHQHSVQWVLEGKADCAAIDSTVLEQAQRSIPDLSQQLRIIDSIGPYPIPPIVVSQRLGTAWIDRLQSALLQPDEELQEQMQQAGIRRFAVVESAEYNQLADLFDRVTSYGWS
jgi:phosphonate transport system substrate-binding protein